VHVLARLHRGDGDGHVPVVGRGDADRVDVVAVEKLAEVHTGLAVGVAVALVGGRLGPLADVLPDVADGDDLGGGAAELLAEVQVPTGAGADVAEDHAVARGWARGAAERRRGEDVGRSRRAARRGNALEKLATAPGAGAGRSHDGPPGNLLCRPELPSRGQSTEHDAGLQAPLGAGCRPRLA